MATVAEIMRRSPIYSIGEKESLRSAAAQMSLHRVGSLLVLDEGRRLIGIITERDIILAIGEGVDPDKTPVERYMSRKPVTARPEDSIVSAAHKMITHGIRHLPVVDESGRVLGIISIRDVLRHILAEHEFP